MPSEILHWCLESSLRWGAFPDYPGSPPGPLLITFHLKAPALLNSAEEAVGKHHCLHRERKGVLGRFSDSYCEIPSYSAPVGGEDWPFCLFCLPAASLMNRFPSRFSAMTLLSQCYCTQASWWAGLVFRVTESSGLIGVKCHKKGRNKVRRSPGNRGGGGGCWGQGERRRASLYCMTGGPVQVSAKRAGHSQELECKVSCSKTLRAEKTPSCSSDSCADFCRGSEGLKWARPTCSAPPCAPRGTVAADQGALLPAAPAGSGARTSVQP